MSFNTVSEYITNGVSTPMGISPTMGYPDDVSTGFSYANSSLNDTDPFHDFFEGDMPLHPHWHQYVPQIESVPDSVFFVLGIYIGIVGIIGTLGNLMVIWIFATTKSLRTPPNMYIISMAVSDLSFSIVIGFPLMTIASFQKRWQWGALACTLYGYISGIFGLISINTLALISNDRHMAIGKPFYALKHASTKRSLTHIIFVWVWSIVFVSPPLFGWGAYIPEGFQVECSFDYISRDWGSLVFNHAMFWFGFAAPVLVIIYSYVNIVRVVGAQRREIAKTVDKLKATTDDKTRQQEIHAAKIAAVSVCLFLLSWLPYAIVSQLGIWNLPQYVTPYTTQVPVLFAKASAMWNPILYALSHPKFRAQLDARFPMFVCGNVRNVDRETSHSTTNRHQSQPARRPKLERDLSTITVDSEIQDVASPPTTRAEKVVNEEMVQMTEKPKFKRQLAKRSSRTSDGPSRQHSTELPPGEPQDSNRKTDEKEAELDDDPGVSQPDIQNNDIQTDLGRAHSSKKKFASAIKQLIRSQSSTSHQEASIPIIEDFSLSCDNNAYSEGQSGVTVSDGQDMCKTTEETSVEHLDMRYDNTPDEAINGQEVTEL